MQTPTDTVRTYTAFAGSSLVASGELETMLLRTKQRLDAGETGRLLIFDDQTGAQIDFDFRGTPDEVTARIASHPHFSSASAQDKPRTGPGRPKLGVVCREVSLLPRHWEWLEAQSGGISVALRKLVDEARKRAPDQQRARAARDAAGKFMWAMAGDLPGFEEASRALFADDHARLADLIREWPKDVREHIAKLTGAPTL